MKNDFFTPDWTPAKRWPRRVNIMSTFLYVEPNFSISERKQIMEYKNCVVFSLAFQLLTKLLFTDNYKKTAPYYRQ